MIRVYTSSGGKTSPRQPTRTPGNCANGIVGPIRLVSRARDIKLAQFTQSVELDTERGDIEMTPGKLPLAAIEARSGSGKIELLLPEKAAFHLEATAERGGAVNDFGPQIKEKSEGRTAVLAGVVGDGPLIKLTANRGWISVRKEGAQPSEVLPDTPGEKVRVRLRRRRHPSLPKTCVIAKSRCDVVG
jgi:hypothetical protein